MSIPFLKIIFIFLHRAKARIFCFVTSSQLGTKLESCNNGNFDTSCVKVEKLKQKVDVVSAERSKTRKASPFFRLAFSGSNLTVTKILGSNLFCYLKQI